MMMAPRVTAFYAALLAIMIILLALRVSFERRRTRIGIGDNGEPTLARRIRAHANAVELVPIGLILLLTAELLAIAPLWLHVFGAALLLGRLLHAWGLSTSSGVTSGRTIGYLLTLAAMLGLAVVLLWQSIVWWLTAL